jgi:hypothetical protein
MPDLFKDQSDEWWLEYLTPLYSRLDVQIDIQVVQAVRKALESYVPGSSVLVTVSETSSQTGVPWYKFFIFFAYAFGRLDSMLESPLNFHPLEPRPPS